MFKLMLLTISLSLSGNLLAEFSLKDIQNLKNDKEVAISSFKRKEKDMIVDKYRDPDLIKHHTDVFYNIVLNFVNADDKKCELKFINDIHTKLKEEKIAESQSEIEEFFKVLRVNHAIDDILYEILSGANKDYFALKELDLDRRTKRIFFSRNKMVAANDLKELYSGFVEFPDESSRCLYQEYRYIINNAKKSDGKTSESLRDVKILNLRAYQNNLIPLDTYHKLEYLRSQSNVNKRYIWLSDYFRIIFNAKNRMIPIKYQYQPLDIENEIAFSSEKVKRRSALTRRKLLYRKYDETQIILLAQVLQKASRRMGVDVDTETKRPYISQEFSTLNPDGERRTYVEVIELDPQSQYNLARRLLRKDVTELQMMDIFVGVKITHEDVVMAALETGYISLEEIEFVVKYDDLWNPNISKFERITGFIFKVAGYSSFFLPPPWNITATIALGVVEGLINNKFKTGAENDNPATFIE